MEGYGAASYGDGIADVYDEWHTHPDDTDAAIERLAALADGGRVLELGVGTGRLALPLAARGVPIEGVEASAAMAARLQAKPGGDAIPVTIGDMATDLPVGPFRLIFAAFNTFFAVLTAEAQRTAFRTAASRLAPEGHFLIEAFVPAAVEAGSRVEVRHLTADSVVLMVSQDDPEQQRSAGHLVELSEAAGVRLRPWAIRYAPPAELDAMAADAGLVLEERWADWAGGDFGPDSAGHVSLYGAAADLRRRLGER
jgi:SAM-dependent methyltransferase